MILIDARDIINRITEERRRWGDDYDVEQVLGDIEDAPTIDAEPVRHGHWIERYGIHDGTYYKCSVCNYNCSRTKENYCSDCGAKMDGESRTDDCI